MYLYMYMYVGSDMTNYHMGHAVRGRFCSALASLLLEGLRPYRIQRLVLNDVWKVSSAFCQEGKNFNSWHSCKLQSPCSTGLRTLVSLKLNAS